MNRSCQRQTAVLSLPTERTMPFVPMPSGVDRPGSQQPSEAIGPDPQASPGWIFLRAWRRIAQLTTRRNYQGEPSVRFIPLEVSIIRTEASGHTCQLRRNT